MNNRMNELKEWAKEWDCSLIEAAMEILSIHFEAAGFRSDVLAEELSSLTDNELMRLYFEF